MKEIEFRRPFFKNKDNSFSHFSYWGINYPKIGINNYPSSNNKYYNKEDQQYTGLKDKNGKKIYEGDIIFAHLYGIIEYNIKSIIEFKNGCFGITALYDEVLLDSKGKFKSFEDCNTENVIEIIGNIYENTELIK